MSMSKIDLRNKRLASKFKKIANQEDIELANKLEEFMSHITNYTSTEGLTIKQSLDEILGPNTGSRFEMYILNAIKAVFNSNNFDFNKTIEELNNMED